MRTRSATFQFIVFTPNLKPNGPAEKNCFAENTNMLSLQGSLAGSPGTRGQLGLLSTSAAASQRVAASDLTRIGRGVEQLCV